VQGSENKKGGKKDQESSSIKITPQNRCHSGVVTDAALFSQYYQTGKGEGKRDRRGRKHLQETKSVKSLLKIDETVV